MLGADSGPELVGHTGLASEWDFSEVVIQGGVGCGLSGSLLPAPSRSASLGETDSLRDAGTRNTPGVENGNEGRYRDVDCPTTSSTGSAAASALFSRKEVLQLGEER